ncbi:MAG: DUF1801 domain-containing protein [Chloroflexi bacterium]|nr:MAG: DUF1801 domain-containing protein [Chloroflexota bacterium]
MTNSDPAVESWMAVYENPMKEVVARVREIVLDADPRITETIKWSTPTFMYLGNLMSFQPRATRFASLLFHEGASIPGDHPHLDGGGDHARYMRIADLAEAEATADELRSIVRAWCDARDAAATGP